jgi:hypothetical protein
MAHLLSPQQAAAIASGVYKLQTTSVSELRANQQTLGCEGLFSLSGDGARLNGYSGALRWKTLSGFGYVAEGEAGTPFADDVLVATRGTLGAKTGPDWLSNYNIGVQLGPTSLPVHAGFNEIWKTFRDQLSGFFDGRRAPRRVHCVGHSLGGALATLNADYLTGRRIAVSLYTFGAPRVGDAVFARSLTRRVGVENIQRVYHPSDPVPMIPLFPFWHMPFGHSGLQIANQIGGLINASAHGMEKSYVATMAGFTDWDGLRAAAAQRADDAAQAKTWLQNAADGRGSFLMGSATLLSMIGKALGWLLKQTGKLIANVIGGVAVVGLSVLDHLAWALSEGARLSKEIGGHVKTVIGAIWGFLGRKAMQVAEVTVAFLRWLLELLFTTVRSMAERALSLLS